MKFANLSPRSLALLVASLLAQEPALAQEELFKLTASDGQFTSSYFGTDVAIGGNRTVIGAPYDTQGGITSGSVYVYDAITGQELLKLNDSSPSAEQRFGWSVATRGSRAIVGAPGSTGVPTEFAVIFDILNGQELHTLMNPTGSATEGFGSEVGISGSRAIVAAAGYDGGAGLLGAAYIFDVDTGQLLLMLQPDNPDPQDFFGLSVAISGSRALVGAPGDSEAGAGAGAVYVFDVATGQQLHKLMATNARPDDFFGGSVDISGTRAVIGAHRADVHFADVGAAFVFDVTSGVQHHRLEGSSPAASDYFGRSVSISGERVAVGANGHNSAGGGSGAVFVFDANTGQELFLASPADLESGDELGYSVSISGDRLVAGARYHNNLKGAAWIYSVDGPGTSYCSANSNSTGHPSEIHAFGSPSRGDEFLGLNATNAPVGQFGLFYAGSSTLNLPFGDGIRCVGGQSVRLSSPILESGGAYAYTIDFSLHQAFLDGLSTAHFQCWYRDPAGSGSGFNLSNGLSLVFVP